MKQFFRIINYFPKVSGCTTLLIFNSFTLAAQLNWVNVDSLYQPLPASVHVFKTTDSLNGKPNIAFYVIADLKDKAVLFDVDTTLNRRLTPQQFYQKNDQPLVVVNTTFFSFQTNQNLNLVIKNGKLVVLNPPTVSRMRMDSLIVKYIIAKSAIGISRNRQPDIAWIMTDSIKKKAFYFQLPLKPTILNQHVGNSNYFRYYDSLKTVLGIDFFKTKQRKWQKQTSVGGGPVLLQQAKIFITNEEEMMFTGKAVNDKHPRTAMGYTKDNKLIILVVQGRFPGIAEGATLTQEAQILKDLGCWEALNLDGGGSSCMLINGKETIKPSDATGQRAIPAVFIIRNR